jgi:hypothetical protein
MSKMLVQGKLEKIRPRENEDAEKNGGSLFPLLLVTCKLPDSIS